MVMSDRELLELECLKCTKDVVQLLKDCKHEFKESYDDVKHERIAYMNNYRSLIKRINKVLYNDI